jgi:hypothetical protein
MKTITIEIPDWAEERNIYVLAGIELLAYQEVGKPLMVKTERCSMCGECCCGMEEGSHFFGVVDEHCEHLKKEVGNNNRWYCNLKYYRPIACCTSIKGTDDYCTVKFEEK